MYWNLKTLLPFTYKLFSSVCPWQRRALWGVIGTLAITTASGWLTAWCSLRKQLSHLKHFWKTISKMEGAAVGRLYSLLTKHFMKWLRNSRKVVMWACLFWFCFILNFKDWTVDDGLMLLLICSDDSCHQKVQICHVRCLVSFACPFREPVKEAKPAENNIFFFTSFCVLVFETSWT